MLDPIQLRSPSPQIKPPGRLRMKAKKRGMKLTGAQTQGLLEGRKSQKELQAYGKPDRARIRPITGFSRPGHIT